MRIVAGKYGGRSLDAPQDNKIRPTSDKVRAAIFNALLSRIDMEDAIALDTYCGSGALGLEALSRGAQHCTFLDKSRTSLDLCKHNAETLGAEQYSTFLIKDSSKSITGLPHPAYNLIFLDPPYNKALIEKTIDVLEKEKLIIPSAIIILESEKNWKAATGKNFTIESEKTYGDTKITITRYSLSK